MSDINWRRRIQPSRARSPTWNGDELEALFSPTTPRNANLNAKASSYFTQRPDGIDPAILNLPPEGSLLGYERPPSPERATRGPDPGKLIDSILCRLLTSPLEPLDVALNGGLLRIFEAYRHLQDENQTLDAALSREVEKVGTLELAMRQSVEAWERERLQYKAEVKRLELLLAKGERGLAEVTLARQESVLQRRSRRDEAADRTLSTIFEILERSRRYEEGLFNHQRASMRKRPVSPSVAMRRLSKQLLKNSAVDVIKRERPRVAHASNGKVAPGDWCAGVLRYTGDETEQHVPSGSFDGGEAGTAYSETSASTFSCEGDFLPDEDAAPVNCTGNIHARSDDMADARSTSLPSNDVQTAPASRKANLVKQPTLKTKASEFFAKWRSPLRMEMGSTTGRRFSFEAGDDADASLSAIPVVGLTSSVQNRLLRKSASTSILFDISDSDEPPMRSMMSPIRQSPSTPASQAEPKKATRIPTPVYSAALHARPRTERDSSTSSLFTAMKCSDGESVRTCSYSGSTRGSPPSILAYQSRETSGAEGTMLGLPGSENVPSRTNAQAEYLSVMQGNTFAVAAARAASTATHNVTTRPQQQAVDAVSNSWRPQQKVLDRE